MIKVNAESFELAKDEDRAKYGIGSVEVTIKGKTARVPASDHGDRLDIYGLAVKYRSGAKVWSGSAIFWKESKRVNNLRGRMDRRSLGNDVELLGFYADYAEAVKSDHVADKGRK